MSERVLVLAEPVDAGALGARFAMLGWSPMRHLPDAAQQAADDCVLAGWNAPDGGFAQLVSDGLIHTLALHDAGDAVEQAFASACCDTPRVLERLGSLDAREVLVAARTAGALADPALAAGLAPLRHHPDDAVRAEASVALARLLPHLIEAGARWLDVQQRRRRGANPLWDMAGPAWLRRQTLRWLLHDHPAPSQGVEATLRAALTDPDWEVRAGALIGAVRLRLRTLGGLVEHCVLPTVSRNGPDAADRALLRALRHVGAASLAGREPLTVSKLAGWLTGDAPPLDDPAGRLVHALITPMAAVDAPVEVLRRAGIAVVAVPQAGASGRLLIASEPVGGLHGPLQLEAEAALAWCRLHSGDAERLRLPTVAEWTWVAGGTDGRRFPWGNGFQDDAPAVPGPWGTWGHAGAEWAQDDDGSLVCCGPRCDARGGTGPALLRPVVVQ